MSRYINGNSGGGETTCFRINCGVMGGGDSGLSQNDGAGLMGASFIKRCMTFCVSQKGTQRFIKRGVFQKGGNIDVVQPPIEADLTLAF